MLGLTYLYADYSNIADLTGLEYATNLEWLYLDRNPLNTAAYCTYIPLIASTNPYLQTLQYGPNPNPLTFDCSTDLTDFAAFAEHWLEAGCDTPNNWCSGADLDHRDNVDINDLATFTCYWLK